MAKLSLIAKSGRAEWLDTNGYTARLSLPVRACSSLGVERPATRDKRSATRLSSTDNGHHDYPNRNHRDLAPHADLNSRGHGFRF